MKNIKIFTIFLFMIITLTGCFPKDKTANNPGSNSQIAKANPVSPQINSNSNNVKSVTIKPQTPTIKPQTPIIKPQKQIVKPQKPTIKINKPDTPSENSDKIGSVNSSKDKVKKINKIKETNGFVLLSSLDSDILINLKYATTDNFTKKIIYPNNVCVLRKTTAQKLISANEELNKLGYRIKVWDAYRPVYVQQIFWDIVKDSRFVANPKNGGSIHNKGCAVDVTLVNKAGNELKMPTKFDDFSSDAYRNNSNMTADAKKNMDLLTKYMVSNGFRTINTEWWHFEDSNSKNYKIADINLKLF